MARGGYRPNAGRKADPNSARQKKLAAKAAKEAVREPHGYTKPDGTKAEDAPKDWPFGRDGQQVQEPTDGEPPKKSFATPMEYWQHVLKDPEASASAKHAAAFALAPYVHPKLAPVMKKEDAAERAKKAATGRFAPRPAPLKLVGG